MSNTNTIFGWVLASGIVALGLNSVSEKLFDSEVEEFGYVIEAEEEGGAAAGRRAHQHGRYTGR